MQGLAFDLLSSARRARHHRPRRRRHHHRPGRGRRRPPRADARASWASRTARCSATSATRSATTTGRCWSTGPATLDAFRALFGDERGRLRRRRCERHYAAGPPAGWAERYVSAYATAHPWEDWAETFAHYLHIRDTLQTAAAFGLLVRARAARSGGPTPPDGRPRRPARRPLRATSSRDWLPLTYALNAVNRSMGAHDLYPFVLAPAGASTKLAFVHDLVMAAHVMAATP